MRKLSKILLILITFFTATFNVSAEEENKLRTAENNYGINKIEAPTPAQIARAKQIPYVDKNKKIYDYADVLTDEEKSELKSSINDFIRKTSFDLVFVVIDEELYTKEIEEYALDFYDYNDFGFGKRYDGIIILRNAGINSSNRYYCVFSSGEAQLYYDASSIEDVIDAMYDGMHSDRYYEGFEKAIETLSSIYSQGISSKYKDAYVDYNGDIYVKDLFGNDVPIEYKGYLVKVIIGSMFLAILLAGINIIILVNKNKMIKPATRAKEYLTSVKMIKKEDKFVTTHTTSTHISSSSSSGGSHSSHRSGSSGISHSGGGRHC